MLGYCEVESVYRSLEASVTDPFVSFPEKFTFRKSRPSPSSFPSSASPRPVRPAASPRPPGALQGPCRLVSA